MWLLFNHYRKEGKLHITNAIECIILLMLITIFISGITQTLLSPWMSILCIIWLPAMAWTIWKNGGLTVDLLIIANFLGLKVGEKFTYALVDVFLIQALIVAFGLFVPIWESWSLFLALLVFLIGAILATIAVKTPLKWKEYAYRALWAGVAILIVAIFASFVSGGIELNRGDFFMNRPLFKIMVFGLVALGLGLIFSKKSFGKKLAGLGGIILFCCFVAAFFGHEVKNAAAETFLSKILSPSEQIVSTGYTVAAGERLVITRLDMTKPAPICAVKTTPDGKKSGQEVWPNPSLTWWGVRNTGVEEGFSVSLKLPKGLQLSDLALSKVPIPGYNNGANGNSAKEKPDCPLGEKENNHQAQPSHNMEIIS